MVPFKYSYLNVQKSRLIPIPDRAGTNRPALHLVRDQGQIPTNHDYHKGVV
jgi:hypothetical protein